MRQDLFPPRFTDGVIEISVRPEGISIDTTIEGLEKLLKLLQELKSRAEAKRANEHIHLEDYQILTSGSPPTVVGVFFSIPVDVDSGQNSCLNKSRNAAGLSAECETRWSRILRRVLQCVLR